MIVKKLETKYYVETSGQDDYGMDVGNIYKLDCEEDMIRFLEGEYVSDFGCSMSYYEYPTEVYSKTEYSFSYKDE